jgi:hypothetical protein
MIEILRFPWYALHVHNGMSVRNRVSKLRKWWLSERFRRFVNADNRRNTPTADYRYVTLVCNRDVLLSQASLFSVLQSVKRPPVLTVVSDGTLSSVDAIQALRFWPNEIEFLVVENVAAAFYDIGATSLSRLCKSHVFGLKLGACLFCAMTSRVLYSDSDVLWFRDPEELINLYRGHSVVGTTDFQHSYDKRFLKQLPEKGRRLLEDSVPVNAGVAIWQNAAGLVYLVEDILRSFLRFSPETFTEQTIVAYLSHAVGTVMDGKMVYLAEEPRSCFNMSWENKPWYARHYAGPCRDQFWIDASVFRADRLSSLSL